MPVIHNRFTNPAKKGLAGSNPHNPLSVIFLSSTFAYRMKAHGPKCLFKIDKIPLIEHQIRVLREQYPHSEFVVIAGFECDKVIKIRKDFRIVENALHEENNGVQELRLGLNNIQYDNVLIVDGDIFFDERAAGLAVSQDSSVIIDEKGKFDREEVGVCEYDNQITNFSFSLKTKFAGISFLTGKELELCKKYCTRDKTKQVTHEMLQYIIEKGGKLVARKSDEANIYRVSEQ